ncbi:hypothetical protein ILYODFUR_028884 [Ilyodon furcidens]|uniref:Uncharacterized protein n=1 Tax=Ilyodon furcidens TaxID=33524 RepID=A0ABV0TC94_9TELE
MKDDDETFLAAAALMHKEKTHTLCLSLYFCLSFLLNLACLPLPVTDLSSRSVPSSSSFSILCVGALLNHQSLPANQTPPPLFPRLPGMWGGDGDGMSNKKWGWSEGSRRKQSKRENNATTLDALGGLRCSRSHRGVMDSSTFPPGLLLASPHDPLRSSSSARLHALNGCCCPHTWHLLF